MVDVVCLLPNANNVPQRKANRVSAGKKSSQTPVNQLVKKHQNSPRLLPKGQKLFKLNRWTRS